MVEPPFTEPPVVQAKELTALVRRGLAWKTLSTTAGQASSLIVAVVLARLLSPSDFGTAGMALVFSSLVLVFSDLALGAALVQRRTITEADKATVFWLGLAAGAVMTAVGFLSAGAIARFYGVPEVKPLFQGLSALFVISSLGATQSALLTREMNFRALESRVTASVAVGAVVGIGIALAGGGAWAIIGQQISVAVASTLLLWRFSSWRPALTFSLQSLRDLGGFSADVFGQRVMYYAHRNADNLLIGKFIGSSALGAYSVAYNIMLMPFSRIGGPVQQVMFPAFARRQHDVPWLARTWLRTSAAVGALTMPALMGLVVVAPDFVHVVLGNKWTSVVVLLQILAWVGIIQSLQTTNGDILQARDRTRLLLVVSTIGFCGHITGFVVGLHWGVVGVASGYAISSAISGPFFSWVTARVLGLRMRDVIRALLGVTAASGFMALVVLGLRLSLDGIGISAPVRLLLCTAVGVLVYLPALLITDRGVASDLRRLVTRRGAVA